MASSTSHYQLSKLEAGDTFAEDSYKHVSADRDLIDNLAYRGAESHKHDGAAAAPAAPTVAPSLTVDTASGVIPSGTRVYYRYSYVNADGFETAASPEAYVDTAAAITEPNAPSLVTATTGGTLVPGQYYYVLSAYKTSTTLETKATNINVIDVPAGTNTNKITLTMPSLPTGATGFNIYRRKPGSNVYRWLASTTGSSYEDTGSVTEDATRTTPNRNTTNSTNNVLVALPGTTPSVPEGCTWRIYRTYVTNNYRNSLLKWVVELTGGEVNVTYTDNGIATTTGEPMEFSRIPASPSKILLTGGAEVQGTLPASYIQSNMLAGNLADRPSRGFI